MHNEEETGKWEGKTRRKKIGVDMTDCNGRVSTMRRASRKPRVEFPHCRIVNVLKEREWLVVE